MLHSIYYYFEISGHFLSIIRIDFVIKITPYVIYDINVIIVT